jgi:protein TonB
MGVTEKKAVDPTDAAKPAGGSAAPSSVATQVQGTTQRVASRIPTRDATFEEPKRIRPNKPEYPVTLKAQNIEGNVVVSVDISESGRVTRVNIVQASGYPEFDEAARRAALSERFSPAMRDGRAVAFTLSYTYRFRIED